MKIISDPIRLLDERDPLAVALFKKYNEIRMPKLGLPEADVNALIEYMKNHSATVATQREAGMKN
jgi:protein SCO1/2